MKNRVTTITVLLFFSCCAHTQDNRHSVINSSGGSSHQGYYQFEWSVGELALINQMTDVGKTLLVTNGFIQPYILYPGRNNSSRDFDADEIRIFPNPATEYVEINFFTKQKGKITVHFYDASGKRVFTRELTSNGVDLVERIPVTKLPQGIYVLNIVLYPTEGSVSKQSAYKIIKAQ